MKQAAHVCLVLLVMAMPLFAQTPAALNIAVNDLVGKGIEQSSADIISDRLRSELISTGVFKVMERNEMATVLKEQGFQKTGVCDEASCLVQVGQMLGVERMVAGTVGKIGALYTISLRMINVTTSQIMFTVNEDFEGDIKGVLAIAVGNVARKLAGGAGGEISKAALSGKTGDLYITSEPQGAAIEIDGKAMTGEAPITLKGIAAGEHRIAARKDNYYGSKTVSIAPDDLLKVSLTLEKGKGSLKLFTTPDVADVLLDDEKVGTTPLKFDNIAAGEHRLRVSKADYIPEESNVHINNNEIKNLNVTLKPAAWVTVKCSLRKARILVNGIEAGSGEIIKYEVPAGNVTIQAEHPGYEAFSQTITLAKGEDKEVGTTLASIFGSLKVTSEPHGATVFLNDRNAGTTPYSNVIQPPGDYLLKLKLDTYNDAVENITVIKNQTIARTIVLTHTQAYLDTMKVVGKAKHIRSQWVRRILFGGLAAVALGSGIYMNSLVQQNVDNQKQIQADYRAATSGFSDYRSRYDTEGRSAANNVLYRNILYSVGGAFTIGCLISVPF